MNRFFISLLLLTGFLTVLSCDRDAVKPTVIRMQVADHTGDCNGPFSRKCLLVKQNDDPDFLYFYDSIEGFTYEDGYEYTLLVQRGRVDNPPADGSSFRYRLVRQISRTKP